MINFDPHKVCMICKNLEFQEGHQAYSDVTPATPCVFYCKKNHWYESMDEDLTKKHLYKCMNKAQTCIDFEVRTSDV